MVLLAQMDVGLVVRPKRYRAVLMDQDVLHKCSSIPTTARQIVRQAPWNFQLERSPNVP